jgi:diguanylate cyclase (GGDEF)-like protein
MGRVAGGLYVAGAVMTVLGILLPHARQADITGFWAIALGTAAAGALLLRFAPRIPLRGYQACMLVGSVTVTLSLYFNGERFGAHSAGNQVLYLWIALFSGYFFSRAAVALQLLVVAGLYAGVLGVIDPGSVAITRWVITVGMVSSAAVIVHILKRHNDELLGRLSSAARTDSLTGLANRQGFEEGIARELTRAGRTGSPVTLIIADIDRFKDINDRFGHAEGDAALRAVGETAGRIVRSSDTAARIGGDEFAVILPDTDAVGAFAFAERLREAAMGSHSQQTEPLTISLGIAESAADGVSPDLLTRSADSALYEAKELGRNQTVAAAGAQATMRTQAQQWRTVPALHVA